METFNFQIIAKSSRSVTLELFNDQAYYSDQAYHVYLDNKLYIKNEKKNVISLYNLEPGTSYDVKVLSASSQGVEENFESGESFTTDDEYVLLNVKTFGAKGDGVSLDSYAIQAAIASCPDKGTVYIPSGIYLCSPLFLKSHITLYLEKGAILLGTTDRSLYPILPGCTMTSDEKDEYYLGTWEGNPLSTHASLITAIGIEDTAIVGQGIIDGNAEKSDWWINPKVKREAWRPKTIFFKGCKDILVQGVIVRNSPSWTVHPYLSERLAFIDMTIKNDKDSPNTDGIDPESCEDVKIIGTFISVGDDCIAIKAGKLYMGQKLKRPSKNFLIRNCHMQSGHGAVVMGSEMSGGIQDIKVSRCFFDKTDRGIRVKTRRGRGKDAIIDQISFDTIEMRDVLTPFVINMFYFCDPDGMTEYVYTRQALAVDDWTPYLGEFIFKDIRCQGAEVAAAFFAGLPEQPIRKVTMDNVYIAFKEEAKAGPPAMLSFVGDACKRGFSVENVDCLKLSKVKLKGCKGETLIVKGVKELIGEIE